MHAAWLVVCPSVLIFNDYSTLSGHPHCLSLGLMGREETLFLTSARGAQICTRCLSPSEFQRQAGAAAASAAAQGPLAWQQALLVDAPCAAPGAPGDSGAENPRFTYPDPGSDLAMPLGAWLRKRGLAAGADGVAVRADAAPGMPTGLGQGCSASGLGRGSTGGAHTGGRFGDAAARGAGAGPCRPQSSAPAAVSPGLALHGSPAAALRRAGSSTPPCTSRSAQRCMRLAR